MALKLTQGGIHAALQHLLSATGFRPADEPADGSWTGRDAQIWRDFASLRLNVYDTLAHEVPTSIEALMAYRVHSVEDWAGKVEAAIAHAVSTIDTQLVPSEDGQSLVTASIVGLSTADIPAITADQVAALTTEQVVAAEVSAPVDSVTQVDTAAQTDTAEVTSQEQALSTDQVAALTTEQASA